MADELARLTELFRIVFDDDTLVVTPETTAADVSGWDSLTHVTLMLNVEREFGVRFSSREVAMLKNVGELVQLVASRQHVR
ncbi:MAG: acyl carrier protein [Gemmatimonadaceae bacterium]